MTVLAWFVQPGGVRKPAPKAKKHPKKKRHPRAPKVNPGGVMRKPGAPRAAAPHAAKKRHHHPHRSPAQPAWA